MRIKKVNLNFLLMSLPHKTPLHTVAILLYFYIHIWFLHILEYFVSFYDLLLKYNSFSIN